MVDVYIPLYVVRDNKGKYLSGQKEWVDTIETASVHTKLGSARRFYTLLSKAWENHPYQTDKLPLRIEKLNVTSVEVVDLTTLPKK